MSSREHTRSKLGCHNSLPSVECVLESDAVHVKGFFSDSCCSYDRLRAELRDREFLSGVRGAYWQNKGDLAVTRVCKESNLERYPVHRSVVEAISQHFQVQVEGWWVNHYASGSGVKHMHRDGWGRERGVNITIGASFGSTRTLRFEKDGKVAMDFPQENGDLFAFGSRANRLYKHGVPGEPGAGPRISVIVMGFAPNDWLLRLNHQPALQRTHPPEKSFSPVQTELPAQSRRRWGRQGDASGNPSQDPAADNLSSRRWQKRETDISKQRSYYMSNDAVGTACLVWLRDDLRLTDNPALFAAVKSEPTKVVPVFIHDIEDPSPWPVRGAALWWKSESLIAFDRSLRDHCESRLIIRSGRVTEELFKLVAETGATKVYFNRMVEPWYHGRDISVQQFLQEKGLVVETFKAALLQEPWEGDPPRLPTANIQGQGCWNEVKPGKIEHIRTPCELVASDLVANVDMADVVSIINADRLLSNPNPCAQLLTAIGESAEDQQDHRRRDPDHFLVYQEAEAGTYRDLPLPSLKGVKFPHAGPWPHSLDLDSLGYHITFGKGFPSEGMPQYSAGVGQGIDDDWASRMKKTWQPGEEAALVRLRDFVKNIEFHKRPDRHRADLPNTSLLSPHLRFGEVSARTCYREAMQAPRHLRHGFIRRVLWRDLSYAELYRWPDMPTESQRRQYEKQSWSGTHAQLKQWQRGKTGFPLVDAAMRQLWSEGYINNYMRHVTAGFLIDYLDISWKEGFKWYDYTLVDSDAAINARLWQQGGHSGISQWNFVLHPVYAAKNADPFGEYVRRWVPELASMPTEFIHCPWEAAGELMSFGIKLGLHFPKRVVLNIEAARKRHLQGILQVRRDHPQTISCDGTERLLLRDGSAVLLRTRDDIRQDTDELIVAQAPDGVMHKKRGSSNNSRSADIRFQRLVDADLSIV